MRNGYLTIFTAESTAKGGAISRIVPMVTHADHSEHDTMVFITEQGVADIRGMTPTKRAQAIIHHCCLLYTSTTRKPLSSRGKYAIIAK